MFIVHNYWQAILFCVITMLCWGSWANTQKLAGRSWRFELFYWDYVIGILLFSLLSALTAGSIGSEGRPFAADLAQAAPANIVKALIGGIVFNAANILLSAAIAVAGMAVAFPVGIGLALILGVLINYLGNEKGNPVLLFAGVGFVLVAIVLNAVVYKRKSAGGVSASSKGIVLSVVAGVLMSFFYRFIAASMDVENFVSPAAGKMTPYTAVFIFSCGIFASNFVFNTILMRRPFDGPPVGYADYFRRGLGTHFVGILGGLIWGLGNALNLIAAGKAGPAISYGLGQGATLVAAFWGVFIWKEFKGASAKSSRLIALMFLFFLVGLGSIIRAGQADPTPTAIAEGGKAASVASPKAPVRLGETVTIPEAVLRDKIKGGWAGQTIGVTFGGPYEFRYNGTFIQDYQPLFYSEGYIRKTMLETPGLYDDLYMDLTFVDVFERLGLDAPVDSFASAFAHAGYKLWHANQAARYNILHGIKAPASGNWINSPHADDIDYQIESDYAGLMSPGMPNAASTISDKIGHIMNYGDGWYGGVYFGAMYSLAFVSDDVNWIVNEALKAIPGGSTYHQCMADVIKWHQQYPGDWHSTWFELQKKWSSDRACPEGIFAPFDIDATINSAYVVMALLYGNGDFGRTLDIAARAGQDADCNPSSAGGILGTVLGYDKLPDHWKKGLTGSEDIDFKYTTISLNKVYAIGYRHAVENIQRNGGRVDGGSLVIRTQEPTAVRLEQSFPGMYPVSKEDVAMNAAHEITFDLEGTGFILTGTPEPKNNKLPDYVFQTEVWLDGKKIESPALPTDFTTRRLEVCWKYPLPKGKHSVRVKVLNPDERYEIRGLAYIVFSDQRVKHE